MLRYLFLIASVFPFIFLFNTTDVKTEELKVELTAPESAEPGSEFEVEIKITGGKVKGFAKYVDKIPEGIEATVIEVGDATFTADNGQIKILWVNFPDGGEVVLKYKVKVLESATGSIEMGGKFSYLDNNEKRLYSVFKKHVSIGSEVIASNEEVEEAKVDAVVNVKRRVVSSKDNIYQIEIAINQTGIDGFGKVQEFVPLGAGIEKGETKNAVFSSIKNKVKFVWMSIPKEQDFIITYYVDLSEADSKDINSITGSFSYLENDISKKVDIEFGDAQPIIAEAKSSEEKSASTEEQNTSQQTAANEASKSTEESNNAVSEEKIAVVVPVVAVPVKENKTETSEEIAVNETPAVTEDVVEEVNENEEANANSETEQEEIAAVIPDPPSEEVVEEVVEEALVVEEKPVKEVEEPVIAKKDDKVDPIVKKAAPIVSGVRYRVQIAAGKNVVNPAYFKARHNFETDFNIENHQGWVKYTTGSYSMYKDARDSRETINAAGHKFDGPFVTAYSEGARITVQEALMISNQKWYK